MRRGMCLSTHSIMSLSCATADPDDEEEEIAARGAALDRGGAAGRQQKRVEAEAHDSRKVPAQLQTQTQTQTTTKKKIQMKKSLREWWRLPRWRQKRAEAEADAPQAVARGGPRSAAPRGCASSFLRRCGVCCPRPSAKSHAKRVQGRSRWVRAAVLTFQQPAAHQVGGLSTYAGCHFAAQTENVLLLLMAIQRALNHACHGDLECGEAVSTDCIYSAIYDLTFMPVSGRCEAAEEVGGGDAHTTFERSLSG